VAFRSGIAGLAVIGSCAFSTGWVISRLISVIVLDTSLQPPAFAVSVTEPSDATGISTFQLSPLGVAETPLTVTGPGHVLVPDTLSFSWLRSGSRLVSVIGGPST